MIILSITYLSDGIEVIESTGSPIWIEKNAIANITLADGKGAGIGTRSDSAGNHGGTVQIDGGNIDAQGDISANTPNFICC